MGRVAKVTSQPKSAITTGNNVKSCYTKYKMYDSCIEPLDNMMKTAWNGQIHGRGIVLLFPCISFGFQLHEALQLDSSLLCCEWARELQRRSLALNLRTVRGRAL